MIQPQGHAPPAYSQEQNWTPQAYKLPGFNDMRARLIAIIQVIMGCLSITLHALHMGLAVDFNILAHGLWCGAIFVIAGGLMIPGAKRHNKCLIISSMVMSIIAAMAAATMISLCGLGIYFAVVTRYEIEWCIHKCIYIPVSGRVVVLAMMMLVGLVELVVSIWTAVLCCKGSCCAPVVYAEQALHGHIQWKPATYGEQTVIMYPPGLTDQQQTLMQAGASAPAQAYNGQLPRAAESAANETKTALP